MALQSYQELEVWQVAMDLVEAVYRLTKLLPNEERFDLGSQFRRAVVSIPANIAEGYGRSHRREYLHHLSFSRGSAMELDTLLLVALRLGYVTQDQATPARELCRRVISMLTKLIGSLAPD
jgi:four helix bundle protein